jgi:hypothetical protein
MLYIDSLTYVLVIYRLLICSSSCYYSKRKFNTHLLSSGDNTKLSNSTNRHCQCQKRPLNYYTRELGYKVPDGPPNLLKKPSTFFIKTDAEIPYDDVVRRLRWSEQSVWLATRQRDRQVVRLATRL